jgi:hypothetical protein
MDAIALVQELEAFRAKRLTPIVGAGRTSLANEPRLPHRWRGREVLHTGEPSLSRPRGKRKLSSVELCGYRFPTSDGPNCQKLKGHSGHLLPEPRVAGCERIQRLEVPVPARLRARASERRS